jgi:hypothetical protein
MALLARLISTGLAALRPGKRDPVPAEIHEADCRAQAFEALEQGNPVLALSILSALRAPSDPSTLALLGHLHLVTGDFTAARAALDQAEAIDPRHPLMLRSYASLHEHLEDAAAEFRYRKRFLLDGGMQAKHVVAATRAWVTAAAAGGAASTDLSFLLACFRQCEPVAAAHESLEFAELLFSVQAWREEAVALLDKYHPAPSHEERLLLHLTPPQRLAPADLVELLEVADPSQADKTVRVMTFANASVLPQFQWHPWLVESGDFPEGYLVYRLRTRREDATSPLLAASTRELLMSIPRAPKRVHEPAILLGSHPNYYHFLIDHLSRLAVLEAAGVDVRGYPLLVGSDLQPYQRAFFELLGLGGQIQPVPANERWVFDRLVAPCPTAQGGGEQRALIGAWARRRLGAAVPPGPPLKLYVSRAKAGRRRVTNDAQISQWMSARGYQVIHPEDLDVAQQVDLYSRATALVAPAGAALANMIFMAPGSSITMLVNRAVPAEGRMLYFDPLARACGHRFAAVSGIAAAGATDRLLDADMEVPLAELEAALAD